MIERRELQEIQYASRRASFGVAYSKYDPRQADVNNRAGAHRARFLGHVNRALGKPPVPDHLFGLGQREHFRVGGGVLQQFHLVERPGNDPSLANNHRADGNLLGLECAPGLAQRLTHEVMVALQINDRFVGHSGCRMLVVGQ